MTEVNKFPYNYNINIKKEHNKTIVFEITGNRGVEAIARLSLKSSRGSDDKQIFYKLEDINSFDERRGQGTALLKAINKFIEESGAVVIASVRLERESFFKNNGWEELGRPGKSSVTMTYNYNPQK